MVEFSGTHVGCIRGERVVFADVSFRVEGAGALVLTGPNGAGKSSLLRQMAGLLPLAAGSLSWDGSDVARDPDAHRCRVRYVGHADAIKPALTVAENVRMWAVLWGGRGGANDRAQAALEAFGIDRLVDVPGRYLSAGQRRRLALARLLVAPAPLWLLDEPKTALDAEAARRLDRAVERHRQAGGMVVMALHGGTRPEGAMTLDLATSAEAPAC
jgi:heme exporter protein A